MKTGQSRSCQHNVPADKKRPATWARASLSCLDGSSRLQLHACVDEEVKRLISATRHVGIVHAEERKVRVCPLLLDWCSGVIEIPDGISYKSGVRERAGVRTNVGCARAGCPRSLRSAEARVDDIGHRQLQRDLR